MRIDAVGRCVDGRDRWRFEKAAGLGLGGQHPLDAAAELVIRRAGLVEKGLALGRRLLFQRGEEDRFEL